MNTELLNSYPIQIELPVVWGDMDAMQHVNNLVYLKHFESARMAYLEECGYKAIMDETGVGPILRDTNCRYRIPLTYPDRIIVATRVTQMQRDRFKMYHVVYSLEHDAIAAEGESMVVCVDYNQNIIADVPAVMRDAILKLEYSEPEMLD
ncbi:thioesterase family protein [Pontibacterium granulatum]|uniref:acyl-CoA thioesterase n=1 Tax=Pontibacterium granulatum TaxID=2036029 RepID=UPI002499FF34|nr:thioesterase family protein [Pontibacterium granulatum]MDI3326721.1 thioesterase family protein [Pontibacterium granulatum]